MTIIAPIISTLGSSSSLIPPIVKDGIDTGSLIYNSYKNGGKEEGIDRAVDEIGMQVIWIAGIPFFKKISDWTAYKIAKISPKVDTRLLYDKNGYMDWAIENAQGALTKKLNVKDALNAVAENKSLTKSLFAGKVVVSTALTLAACIGLTQAKQRLTKKNVEDSVQKQKAGMQNFAMKNVPEAFKGITFTGLGSKIAKDLAFNPVHNMWVVDAGITGQRLVQSRNKTELAEHAIKEGVFLFTLYGLGEVLKAGMNKFANKVMGTPIDMEIQVLQSDKLKTGIKSAVNEVGDFKAVAGNAESFNKGLFDFLLKNPNNIVVDAAKNSGIISTLKHEGKEVVDTSKYIDVKKLNKLADNIVNFANKADIAGNTDKFIKKAQALKVGSVVTNLAVSCAMLGLVVPKLVYKFREKKTGTCEFHVANEIKDKMKQPQAKVVQV